MKTQSAKAKGRRFQQWVRDKLIESLGIHPEDIESRSMGAGGEDLGFHFHLVCVMSMYPHMHDFFLSTL